MREVLNVHLGQAGIQVGTAAWELFCLEHEITPNGDMPQMPANGIAEDSYNTFFYTTQSGKHVPRCIFVDMEPSVCDEIRAGAYRGLFAPDSILSGKEDCANNFARGYFSLGREMLPLLEQRLRRQCDKCDGIQGFMIYHASGGGTGSGLTALLLEEFLGDEFIKSTKIALTIWPCPRVCNSVVEPYNTAFACAHMLDRVGMVDVIIPIDNEAVYRMCKTNIGIEKPTYTNINRLIAQVVSSLTTSLRFKGDLNCDLGNFNTNLVPFPRLCFMLTSYAPLISEAKVAHEPLTAYDLTNSVFDASNRMLTCGADPDKLKYTHISATADYKKILNKFQDVDETEDLYDQTDKNQYVAACLMYRGTVSPKDASLAVRETKRTRELKFCDWSGTNFKFGINSEPPRRVPGGDLGKVPVSLLMIANSTAVKEVLGRTARKFKLMYLRHKAFMHWYVGEGMEESEFADTDAVWENMVRDYHEISRTGFQGFEVAEGFGAPDEGGMAEEYGI